MNGTELRSFCHFQILVKIAYLDLIRNLDNLLSLKFVFFHCKTVKVSENDQIQIQKMNYKCFLDERKRIV